MERSTAFLPVLARPRWGDWPTRVLPDRWRELAGSRNGAASLGIAGGTCHRAAPSLTKSQVRWCEPRSLRDACQHPRPDLFLIMERKHVVRPAGSLERAVGARLPLDRPADAQQCREDPGCASGRPVPHEVQATSLNTAWTSGS